MEKNIVSLTMAAVGMTLLVVRMEGAHTAPTTEPIKIELERLEPERNPYIGKPKSLNNVAKKPIKSNSLHLIVQC
jgi:hypothetical protein